MRVLDFLRSNTTFSKRLSFTLNVETVLPLTLATEILAPEPVSPLFSISTLSPTLYPSPEENIETEWIPDVLISDTMNSCLYFSSTLSISGYSESVDVM